MKQMKNIKKPTYAVELGKGVFAGSVKYRFTCIKCGYVVNQDMPGDPSPQYGGRCKETSTGNHIWQRSSNF